MKRRITSNLTYDKQAKAGYLRVRPFTHAHRTIHLGDTLIDLDVTDRIVGVEQIGRPVDMESLLAVIQAIEWPHSPSACPGCDV